MELCDVGVLGNAFEQLLMKIDCWAISDVFVNGKLQRIIASDCVSFAAFDVADFAPTTPRAVILYEFIQIFMHKNVDISTEKIGSDNITAFIIQINPSEHESCSFERPC